MHLENPINPSSDSRRQKTACLEKKQTSGWTVHTNNEKIVVVLKKRTGFSRTKYFLWLSK